MGSVDMTSARCANLVGPAGADVMRNCDGLA